MVSDTIYINIPGDSGSGGGVSSLNSLTGALTLVAGSGITVTPSGLNLTIAATGGGSGTVTSVSVVSANGLAGTVATSTTTPAITLSTTITGILKGNGTAISAATAGTDYVIPSGSITGTAGNITATSNGTLTTLTALSLPYSQITGTPTSLVFSDSLVNTSGTVTLVNDSASPGASKYYGTNASSVLGYYTFPSSENAINQLTGDVLAGPTVGSQSVPATIASIQGTTVSGTTGTGNVVFSNSPTFTGTITGNISGTATNITATSNSTLTTLSSLSLPGSQVTGNISGNAANITATSNSTLTTLNSLSLPYSQVTGGPSGTVTSVGLSTPGVLYTVSGSPVTSSGTLTLNLVSQTANTVFAGPTSGSAAVPTFRALVGADIPVDNGTLFVNGSNQIAVQYFISDTSLGSYFLGYGAGNTSTTGTTNTGFGEYSLAAITSGYSNSGFGYGTLQSVTNGFYNTGIGSEAGTLLTTGNSNTAVGYNSLSSAVSTTGNTAIGREALKVTTGSSNTSVGYESLFYNTSGTNNTAIGYQAGHSSSSLITSTDITLLGANTGNSGADGITNSTAIGYGANVTTSNQIVLGNSSVTSIITATPSVLYNSASPMTTLGDMEYYSSGVQRLGIGTTGQVLTVVSGSPAWQTLTATQISGTGSTIGYGLISTGPSTAPTWQPLPSTVSQFFASNQVTTASTGNSNTSFTTFSNSPAFTFTPSVTGTYKVYSGAQLSVTVSDLAILRVFNTTGGATLLNESQGAFLLTVGATGEVFIESVYQLTAGTTYVFDIQGKNNTVGTFSLDGSNAPFYMFAELEIGGSTAAFVGSGRSFLTSGTTYTTPVGITSSTRFKFTLIGGGGGGGGINTTNAHGSGGGGGGCAIVELTGLSASNVLNITIGSGGAGGISTTTAATSGGSTTLIVGATTYTAGGGSNGADTIDTLGGTGGTTTNATIGINGEDGMASGAATASAPWGRGGNSGMMMGAGGAAIIAAGTGKAGTGYGGGGSGGYGATATGGAGSAGCIIVEWWN